MTAVENRVTRSGYLTPEIGSATKQHHLLSSSGGDCMTIPQPPQHTHASAFNRLFMLQQFYTSQNYNKTNYGVKNAKIYFYS